ncbi:methyltransferase domain-containing protein [Mycolicibacterium fortuitum]|uniref:methyltransferase domain-containing protein n=1 Tax=Mycolicibacterium fortuitum TaxID=1766 RepID=UPI0014901536|nr:class I SAM-dependent methyltransferase [Mycolicibacterium fortuitum]
MSVISLPRAIPAHRGKPVLDNVSELQAFARAVAVDGVWSTDIARATTALFDDMAVRWNTEQSTNCFDAVQDALDRAHIPAGGRCLEVGCGTGQITPLLADHFDEVISVDLSTAMLAQAPASASVRICCDASQLPFRDHVFDAAVLVDTFCFTAELARAVNVGGQIIWVNLLGDDGPLYVSADDIAHALPGNWTGVESTAGWGSWAVFSAADPVEIVEG